MSWPNMVLVFVIVGAGASGLSEGIVKWQRRSGKIQMKRLNNLLTQSDIWDVDVEWDAAY